MASQFSISKWALLTLLIATTAEAYTPTKQRDSSKLPVRLWIVHMVRSLLLLLSVVSTPSDHLGFSSPAVTYAFCLPDSHSSRDFVRSILTILYRKYD